MGFQKFSTLLHNVQAGILEVQQAKNDRDGIKKGVEEMIDGAKHLSAEQKDKLKKQATGALDFDAHKATTYAQIISETKQGDYSTLR